MAQQYVTVGSAVLEVSLFFRMVKRGEQSGQIVGFKDKDGATGFIVRVISGDEKDCFQFWEIAQCKLDN